MQILRDIDDDVGFAAFLGEEGRYTGGHPGADVIHEVAHGLDADAFEAGAGEPDGAYGFGAGSDVGAADAGSGRLFAGLLELLDFCGHSLHAFLELFRTGF